MHKLTLHVTLLALGLGFVTALAGDAAAERPGSTMPVASLRPVLTLEIAQQAIDGAVAEAGRLDAGGAIAVVDSGGYLMSLIRLDGTFPAASEVSTSKARTAAIFQRPTKDFEDAVRSGRTTLVAVDPMTPLEGGVPLRIDGFVVGAIGVSGAHSSAEDVRIAEAGAAAISGQSASASSH